MKTLILLLFTTSVFGQGYVSFSVDANKLFGIIDNERTVIDHTGLDFDFEVGVTDRNIGVYLYYGAFPNAKYSNYGFGLDYYFRTSKRLNLIIGNYYSKTMRHKEYSYLGGHVSYFNPRGRIVYWFDKFGIGAAGKYQQRGGNTGRIFEGQIELIYRF